MSLQKRPSPHHRLRASSVWHRNGDRDAWPVYPRHAAGSPCEPCACYRRCAARRHPRPAACAKRGRPIACGKFIRKAISLSKPHFALVGLARPPALGSICCAVPPVMLCLLLRHVLSFVLDRISPWSDDPLMTKTSRFCCCVSRYASSSASIRTHPARSLGETHVARSRGQAYRHDT
jgi:hypothetical protein